MEAHRNMDNQYFSHLTPEELAVLKQCAVEGNQKARPTALATAAALMLGIKYGYIKSKSMGHSVLLTVTAGLTTFFLSRLAYGASCINNLPNDFKKNFEKRMREASQPSHQIPRPNVQDEKASALPAFPKKHDGISLDITSNDYNSHSSQNPDESRPEQSQHRNFANTYETLREQNRTLYEENAKKNDSYKPLASDTFWEQSRSFT